MNATIVRWADFALKGVKNEFAGDAPVRIFVMGDNVWRDEKEFPLARTQYTKYYFHSNKGANSAAGDGEADKASRQRGRQREGRHLRVRPAEPDADHRRAFVLRRGHSARPFRSTP